VEALRLGLRAYRDLYDQIWWMLLALVAWWILNATVVFGPPATFLLFQEADPRQGIWEDRMGPRDWPRYLLSNWVRSWKIALCTLPVVFLLAFNLNFYGSSGRTLSFLTPLWFLLLIVAATASIVIFAVGGVLNQQAGDAIKNGGRITAIRFPSVLLIVLLTAILPLLVISATLQFTFPLFFLIPGLVAMAVSRYVLAATGEPLPNPNEPTDERKFERGKH